MINFFYGVQPWNGVELEHEGLSNALMGILVNFVSVLFTPFRMTRDSQLVANDDDVQSGRGKEMSKPTRVLLQKKDLHTAATAEEPVLSIRF